MVDVAVTPTGSQSPEKQQKVEYILKLFQERRLGRYNFETQWQESALLAWPEWANTFFYGYEQYPGQKKTLQQLDSSVSIASHRFSAIMESLTTPQGKMWSRVKAADDYVMKQKGVTGYYDILSTFLAQQRYRPTSNFVAANQRNMQALGVFGNMNIFPDELYSHVGEKGLHYTSVPVGQVYYVPNHQGTVDGFFRAFRWTAREIYQKWPDTFPEVLKPALDRLSPQKFWIIQYVIPRTDDYMPWTFGPKNKKWASYFISEAGKVLLQESGYRTFPLPHGRYMLAPDEDYGRGPMQMVLATAKTKNAQKGVFLEQGYRAGKPTFLLPEAGLINPQWHPGGQIQGGMSEQGKPRVGVLPVGSIDITEKMMDMEQQIIDEAFLIDLFRWCLKMDETPQMSARQVVEMLEKHAIFLAPVTGNMMTGYLAPMVSRELDVLAYQNMLPPKPPALREAERAGQGDYAVTFDNPITRMQAASEVAGYFQAVEMASEVAKATNDTTVFDIFAFKRSLPEIALTRGFPERWMSTPAEIAQAGKQRQQQQQQEFEVKSLPGKAAIMKAQAISDKAKAGMNTGGTLSGTPDGGMPVMPGQPMNTPTMPQGGQ